MNIETIACAAQFILSQRNITFIAPQDLAAIMGITHTRAAWALQELSWYRESPRCHNSAVIYHRNGSHKDFPSNTRTYGRRLAEKIMAEEAEE